MCHSIFLDIYKGMWGSLKSCATPQNVFDEKKRFPDITLG